MTDFNQNLYNTFLNFGKPANQVNESFNQMNNAWTGIYNNWMKTINSSYENMNNAMPNGTMKDAFANIYNTGELKNIGYYANDATTFYQNRAPLVGREAIVEFLKSDVISNPNKISFKTNEVFVSTDGNQVVEIGYFKVVDSSNTAINTGNYMVLFEKRNGKYVSVRDMSSSDMPVK